MPSGALARNSAAPAAFTAIIKAGIFGVRLMLVQIYDVVGVTVIALGAAFLLVWAGDRLNRAALCWGVAHLALGLAAIAGYHY